MIDDESTDNYYNSWFVILRTNFPALSFFFFTNSQTALLFDSFRFFFFIKNKETNRESFLKLGKQWASGGEEEEDKFIKYLH